MKHGNIKSRLLVTTLAMGVGLAVLFFGNLTSWIPTFDRACVQVAVSSISPSSSGKIIFDGSGNDDGHTNIITSRELSHQKNQSRGYQMITITDDPNRIFEHTPPSPLDYAVILQSLRNRGYTRVVLATRMTWDDEPGLEAKGLSSRLALFEQAVIALPVTRGASPQPLPEPLVSALIPFSQVKGNFNRIPIVNQVTLPAHAGGDAHTLAGFHRIESAPPSAGHIPLLAHWENEGLIPSIELLAIMSAHSIKPEELVVHCGQHIRLGNDGPVIPLDIYGQTPTPQAQSPEKTTLNPSRIPPIKAEELITQIAAHPETQQPEVCLIHATGEKTSSTNILSPTQLANLLKLTPSFPIPGKATHFLRLPRWAEIVMLSMIGLIVYYIIAPLGNRSLAFALCATLLFPLLLAMADLSQHWFGISAPLAALFTAWLTPVKQTSSTQEYNTSDPKPFTRA